MDKIRRPTNGEFLNKEAVKFVIEQTGCTDEQKIEQTYIDCEKDILLALDKLSGKKFVINFE